MVCMDRSAASGCSTSFLFLHVFFLMKYYGSIVIFPTFIRYLFSPVASPFSSKLVSFALLPIPGQVLWNDVCLIIFESPFSLFQLSLSLVSTALATRSKMVFHFNSSKYSLSIFFFLDKKLPSIKPEDIEVKPGDKPNTFIVTYTGPAKEGEYVVKVTFGGQPVPKSPFKIKVKVKVDATKCKAYGPGKCWMRKSHLPSLQAFNPTWRGGYCGPKG